jgi:hypothetical protein
MVAESGSPSPSLDRLSGDVLLLSAAVAKIVDFTKAALSANQDPGECHGERSGPLVSHVLDRIWQEAEEISKRVQAVHHQLETHTKPAASVVNLLEHAKKQAGGPVLLPLGALATTFHARPYSASGRPL